MPGYLVEADIEAALSEHVGRGDQDALAVLLGVAPQRAIVLPRWPHFPSVTRHSTLPILPEVETPSPVHASLAINRRKLLQIGADHV
jgi:hypothetical protein